MCEFWAVITWFLGWSHHRSPLGSSACLASLRRAAANPEFADWATAFPLVSGLRGLTVAVVRVAVEIIPNDVDLLDSWFIPEESEKKDVLISDVAALKQWRLSRWKCVIHVSTEDIKK